MNIADIFGSVRLNLETGEFEVQAAKAADKTAASMGQKMSAGLKKYAAAGIGAAFGAGLSMALSGANELDAATRQLTADAGLTADEAKAASKSMAAMYRDNLQGFDEIGKAMASVHNDLGLVGEAADKATAKFLKYATATGQDAAQSVAAFDDILDAWNLTAEDASSLMDGLIADHQTFGGAIGASQDALAAMAPAMQAANMSIDEGRALLNLFNASGIDSSKAAAALNKAVKELKPGQSLNDLVAQIGAIEDPTLRAQEAMRIFGARSGIGLAQAIKPGMTSLDAFAVSAADAAGATEDAAKAIEDGFGNKVKKAIKGVQGTLAEVGTGMGDLIMVAALLGPKLTTALLSGLGSLGGMIAKEVIPKLIAVLGPKMAAVGLAMGVSAATAEVAAETTGVVAGQAAVGTAAIPAATAAGTGIGTAMGVAAIAAVAAAGVGIALAFKAVVLDPGLQQQSRDIGTAVGKQIVEGETWQLEQSRDALAKGIQDINNIPLGGFLYGDQVRDLTAQLDAVNAEIARRAEAGGEKVGEAATQGVGAGIEKAAPQFIGPVLTDAMRKEMAATRLKNAEEALATGGDVMAGIASGMLAARQKPMDAFNTLKDMLKNAMTPHREEMRLHGQLLSKTLAAGLKSGDPAVRAQAKATAETIANRLATLSQSGGKAGKDAMNALNAGVRSKVPAIRAASLAAKKALDEKLQAAKASASTAGKNAGAAFGNGVASGAGSSGFTFTGSFRYTGKMRALAKGGPITSPSWVGEDGPEVYVPEQAGRILSHEDAMAAVSGAGGAAGALNLTVNITPGRDTSLSTARTFGQAVLDEVAAGLREQRARLGAA